MDTSLGLNIKREILGLDPDVIFSVAGFPVASSTLMSIFVTVLFALLAIFVIRKFTVMPGKAQVVIELLYEQIVGLIDQITNQSARHTKILLPVIGAMLAYLTLANLLPVIPGLSEVTWNGVPVFRGPTSDFNTTIGLSLGSVLVLQWVSIKHKGILGHLGSYFKFKELYQGFRQGISQGFVAMIEFFVGLLDIIGDIAKVISLALRLFGNMYAGQVLMIIIFGAIAFGLPAVWLGMNIFVGVLQAMVFAALVAAYYMLVVPEDEDSHDVRSEANAVSQ